MSRLIENHRNYKYLENYLGSTTIRIMDFLAYIE